MMLQTSFFNFFPNDYINSDPIIFQGSGKKYLNLKTQIPQKVNLDISFVSPISDKAPNFYLKNERRESVSLNEFEGNIVYLSFWFMGCKPCIREIPAENHLVDVFKNEKVKIVSIYMQSSEESWRQIIEKLGVKC